MILSDLVKYSVTVELLVTTHCYSRLNR